MDGFSLNISSDDEERSEEEREGEEREGEEEDERDDGDEGSGAEDEEGEEGGGAEEEDDDDVVMLNGISVCVSEGCVCSASRAAIEAAGWSKRREETEKSE